MSQLIELISAILRPVADDKPPIVTSTSLSAAGLPFPPAGTVQPAVVAAQLLFSTSVKNLGLCSAASDAPHDPILFLLC